MKSKSIDFVFAKQRKQRLGAKATKDLSNVNHIKQNKVIDLHGASDDEFDEDRIMETFFATSVSELTIGFENDLDVEIQHDFGNHDEYDDSVDLDSASYSEFHDIKHELDGDFELDNQNLKDFDRVQVDFEWIDIGAADWNGIRDEYERAFQRAYHIFGDYEDEESRDSGLDQIEKFASENVDQDLLEQENLSLSKIGAYLKEFDVEVQMDRDLQQLERLQQLELQRIESFEANHELDHELENSYAALRERMARASLGVTLRPIALLSIFHINNQSV